jgi:hypothetical protein
LPTSIDYRRKLQARIADLLAAVWRSNVANGISPPVEMVAFIYEIP